MAFGFRTRTSSYDDADDLVFAVAVNKNIPAPGAADAISFAGSSGKPHPQPEPTANGIYRCNRLFRS